jgi:NitT/TauT family transport system ATP-binding protein
MKILHENMSSGGSTELAYAIVIRDLVVEFEKDNPIIDGVSLAVPEGQFVCIVGASGCGKTTVLNVLAGLVQAKYEASARILGDAPGLGKDSIAYMLARDSLLPWRTALANASYGLEIRGVERETREARARELLERVGLKGYENSLPKELSHGMRQRCALARTFAMPAPILLMDEPFGALDAQTKLMLQDLVVDLWQLERRTVIFITHDLAEAVAIGDRIVVMGGKPGRIVADLMNPLPRPRQVRRLQKDPMFHEVYASVWKELEQGGAGEEH